MDKQQENEPKQDGQSSEDSLEVSQNDNVQVVSDAAKHSKAKRPAELIATRVPKQSGLDKRLKGLAPVSALYAEHVHKYIAYAFGFSCLLIAIGVISWNAHVYKQPVRFIALDGGGTYHVGMVSMDDTPVFQSSAMLATKAHFLRSPVGVDYPELINALYLPAARAALASELEAQAEDFRVRSLRQKPEIREIRALRERDGIRFVEVHGELIRSGSFRGVPIVETEPFAILFAMQRNPNLGQRGQFPFVVVNYRLAEIR